MRSIYLTMLALWLGQLAVSGQYLSLSYPKDNSVMQRDNNNQATVTIAGQLVWGTGANGGILPGTSLSYKIKTLNVNPNVQGPSINLVIAANGMFFATTTLLKAGIWSK
jgi:hypothetical protein